MDAVGGLAEEAGGVGMKLICPPVSVPTAGTDARPKPVAGDETEAVWRA